MSTERPIQFASLGVLARHVQVATAHGRLLGNAMLRSGVSLVPLMRGSGMPASTITARRLRQGGTATKSNSQIFVGDVTDDDDENHDGNDQAREIETQITAGELPAWRGDLRGSFCTFHSWRMT